MDSAEDALRSAYHVLEELNVWWWDPDWHTVDADLQAVESSGIRPRMLYVMREKWLPGVGRRRDWGVRVIRGPRRVGKTTLTKLFVREAIAAGFEPRSIVYMSLDNEDLRRIIVEGGLGLRRLLRSLILDTLNRYGVCVLILDEATLYEEWALALKNLVDEGVVRRPGVLVIVTGSYSLELHRAKRELEGRMGRLGDDTQGQRFLYPLRFVEVAENLSDGIYDYLKSTSFRGRHKLLHKGERLAVLEALSTPGDSSVLRLLEDAWDNVGREALAHLEGLYLLTGGFPRPLHELRYNDVVGDDNYIGFFELLVGDAGKFGLDPGVLRSVMREALAEPVAERTLSDFQVEVESAKGKGSASRRLKADEARRYLDYLVEGSRVLFKFQTVRPASGSRSSFQPLDPAPQRPFKIAYSDPFIFHSIHWPLAGLGGGIFEAAKNLLSRALEQRGQGDAYEWRIYTGLYEATVCSHVARVTMLKYGVETGNYGRLVGRGEHADCVVWYYDNLTGRHQVLPVEVTVSPKPDEVVESARAVHSSLGRRLVVASRDTLDYVAGRGYDAVLLPAALLLLFI